MHAADGIGGIREQPARAVATSRDPVGGAVDVGDRTDALRAQIAELIFRPTIWREATS